MLHSVTYVTFVTYVILTIKLLYPTSVLSDSVNHRSLSRDTASKFTDVNADNDDTFVPYTYVIEIINEFNDTTKDSLNNDQSASDNDLKRQESQLRGLVYPNDGYIRPRLISEDITKKVEVYVEEGFDKSVYDHKDYDKFSKEWNDYESYDHKINKGEITDKKFMKITPNDEKEKGDYQTVQKHGFKGMTPPQVPLFRFPVPFFQNSAPVPDSEFRVPVPAFENSVPVPLFRESNEKNENRNAFIDNWNFNPSYKDKNSKFPSGDKVIPNLNLPQSMSNYPKPIVPSISKHSNRKPETQLIPVSNKFITQQTENHKSNEPYYLKIVNRPKNIIYLKYPPNYDMQKYENGLKPLSNIQHPHYSSNSSYNFKVKNEYYPLRHFQHQEDIHGNRSSNIRPLNSPFKHQFDIDSQENDKLSVKIQKDDKMDLNQSQFLPKPNWNQNYNNTTNSTSFDKIFQAFPSELLSKKPCLSGKPKIAFPEIGTFVPHKGPGNWYKENNTADPHNSKPKGQVDFLRERVYTPILNEALCIT